MTHKFLTGALGLLCLALIAGRAQAANSFTVGNATISGLAAGLTTVIMDNDGDVQGFVQGGRGLRPPR